MEITKYWNINMMKIDPGAIGFTSGFSQEHRYFTVGVGETDPPTPMGTGPLSVRRGAEAAQRADRGSAHEQFTQLRSSQQR